MPLTAPPTPKTPWSGDSRPDRASSPRRRHRLPRILGISALTVLLISAIAGFALFSLSNGVPANPVFVPSQSGPVGSLVPHSPSSPSSPSSAAQAPVIGAAGTPGACVSGNRDTFGKSVTVDVDEWVCGNVSVYGGSATVLGHVNGNVTVVGGSADIAGRVDGNVTAIGGSIHLRSGATVGGNVDAVGGSITRSAGATVNGNVEQGLVGGATAPHWLGVFDGASFPWFHVLFWALAGLIVAVVFPAPLRRVRDVARREPAMSFVAGLAALFFGVLAALVLFITCLGIPIALLMVLALWLAWIVGTVALGYWIGEGLLRMGSTHDRAPVVAAVLGVTLLSLFEAIPCLGGVISFVAGFMGLGASALALLYSRRATAWRSRMRDSHIA